MIIYLIIIIIPWSYCSKSMIATRANEYWKRPKGSDERCELEIYYNCIILLFSSNQPVI